MRTTVFASAILLLLLSANSQAATWRGIVPLTSTRADVERLLGKPNELGRYQFDNEFAYIYYREAPCDDVADCECLVPKDTVLSIVVTPEVERKFSKLRIDRMRLTLTRGEHLPTVVTYSDDEKGIIYTADEDRVIEITYLPSEKDCKRLLRQHARPKANNKFSSG